MGQQDLFRQTQRWRPPWSMLRMHRMNDWRSELSIHSQRIFQQSCLIFGYACAILPQGALLWWYFRLSRCAPSTKNSLHRASLLRRPQNFIALVVSPPHFRLWTAANPQVFVVLSWKTWLTFVINSGCVSSLKTFPPKFSSGILLDHCLVAV